MRHETCNAGHTCILFTNRRTKEPLRRTQRAETTAETVWRKHRAQTVNFVDCSTPSPSLSCAPAGREPAVPFRFAPVPPSISGSHQLPSAASVGGWRYYRSDSARGRRRDRCRQTTTTRDNLCTIQRRSRDRP